MKRSAIILNRNLNKGESAVVSAILMGEGSRSGCGIYSNSPVIDKNGNQHSGVMYSTTCLKAGEKQLLNLMETVSEIKEIKCICFSKLGQNLNNQFDKYKNIVTESSTQELSPVGIVLIGQDSLIRKVTKKFSVLK